MTFTKLKDGVRVELTQEEIDALPTPPTEAEIEAKQLAAEKAAAEEELRKTDWVVIRAMEQYLIEQNITKDLPTEVVEARTAARVTASRTTTDHGARK